MRRKYSKNRQRSTKKTPSLERKASSTKVKKTVEEKTYHVHSTPSKHRTDNLIDERWDVLPKTDYTYARSPSYSPRFFGRKYVNPNMSRYRIRDGRGSGVNDNGEEEVIYMEYSDDDVSFSHAANEDSDSDVSYETVIEDGISLRSGKNLKTMRDILHEHDTRLSQSEIIQRSRHSLTTSKQESRSRRSMHDRNENAQTRSMIKNTDNASYRNQKQYSQTERKNYTNAIVDTFNGSQNVNFDSNIRSRRSLNSQFTQSQGKNVINLTRSNGSVVSKSQPDGAGANRVTRRVRRTVTEEYLDDTDGVLEKGNTEISEKMSQSLRQSSRQNINHMYGLDSDGEFSDSNSSSTDMRRSYSGSSSSCSTSTTTTIITTITENFFSITSPIIRPVWNNVGRPVWNSVVQPVWASVVQPVTTLAASLLTSMVYLSWLLVTRPILYLGHSLGQFASWLSASDTSRKGTSLSHCVSWFNSQVTVLSSQLLLLDAWFYKRRRGRGCCWCLPLLLLLPLLLAVWAGVDIWSGKESLSAFFSSKSCAPPVIIHDKGDYTSGALSAELRTLILELQAGQQKGLTGADVEATVYRILAAETASLRAKMDAAKNQDSVTQLQWKTEQEVKLGEMQKKQDLLLATIKDLEAGISSQRASLDEMNGESKLNAGKHVTDLEGRLAGLHTELKALQSDQAALLALIKDCCHNRTLIAAAINDGIDVILAQMMSGKDTGHPAQDAFIAWLQSQFVRRQVLDQRLQEVSDDLTARVLALLKEQVRDQVQDQLTVQQTAQTHASLHVGGIAAGLDEQHVRLMIEEALLKFSADKIAMPDFALESAGGSIVSTRCSETYYKKTGLISLMGLPIWYTANSPRTIIQPEVYPGQCWPFSGAQGYIVIKAATTIKPTGFTMEHIPKSLAAQGEIDSAPKDFTVLGLESESDENGVSLGNFTYNADGKPIQLFPVQVSDVKPFNLYELKILSNHGNPVYTCLYRFRIHGKVYRP